jgi:adenylate cyclase
MYVDLIGSSMSLTLPVEKLVIIIRTISYDISSIVQNNDGYVLKFVGDAVIIFFPSSYKLLACQKMVQ